MRRTNTSVFWNSHPELSGKHAFLGGSNYHWLGDDDEKLIKRYQSMRAKELGTDLHDIAARLISYGFKLKENDTSPIFDILGLSEDMRETVVKYVNDAIDFHMRPEQCLCYSDVCFGTADAISFDETTMQLRIHDLKTGETPAKIDQLYIYAALFCLEYGIKPGDIDMELRIYQSCEVFKDKPEPQIILPIMDKIQRFDAIITKLNDGG
jgi:hypothetical protein